MANVKMNMAERLKIAREAAGFETAADFAVAIGIDKEPGLKWSYAVTEPVSLNPDNL